MWRYYAVLFIRFNLFPNNANCIFWKSKEKFQSLLYLIFIDYLSAIKADNQRPRKLATNGSPYKRKNTIFVDVQKEKPPAINKKYGLGREKLNNENQIKTK